MKLSKTQVQDALQELKATPIFNGSSVFLLFDEPIDIENIRSTEELIVAVFKSGQNSKIHEIKKVLKILDPRN